MKICRKCGNKLSNEDKKCPVCKVSTKDSVVVDDNDTVKIEETIASIRTMSQSQPNKKKGKGCLIAVVIVIILAIIGGMASGNKNENPKVPVEGSATTATDPVITETVKVEDFEIVGDLTTKDDGFAFYISGTIKNNTDRDYSYAQVTFNLYDSSGSQIGTALDNINNFEANGTWKFKAMGMGENGTVSTYKFVEVTAF